MSGPPLDVTVAVFCFNQAGYVTGCLGSVLDQDPAAKEIYFVDDGSADASIQVACGFLAERGALDRVTVLADGTNRRLPARMNEVLRKTTSEWVIWVASDDMLMPGALTVFANAALEHRDVDVFFGDLAVMDERGTPLGYVRPGDTFQAHAANRYRTPGHPYWDILRNNNFVPGGMTMIRASVLEAVGGYDERERIEDMDMWLRIGCTSRFAYLARTVGRYRIVPGSQSRRERENVLDHAGMLRRRTLDQPEAKRLVARLVAMRLALAVARSRGRLPVGLSEVARAAGLARREIVAALPVAVLTTASGFVRARLAGRARA